MSYYTCNNYEEYFLKWKNWFLYTSKTEGPRNIITINKWIKNFYDYKVCHLYSRVKRLRINLNIKGRKTPGITKYREFLLYGKEEGLKRWAAYCNKQAYTNSQEYKGMTNDEFKAYNKSRAATKENLIKRHGRTEGLKRWKSYVEKQIYTKSKQRYIDEFGVENGGRIFNEINKKKAITLKHFISKYGEEQGNEKFNNWLKNARNPYSKEASAFFAKLEEKIGKKCCYRPHTNELVLYNKEMCRPFFYDFYCKGVGIVEYNGSIFHGNPTLYEANDFPNPWNKNLNAKRMWEMDEIKREFAVGKGYRYFTVWDTFAKKENAVEQVYNALMDFNIKQAEFI